MPDRFVVVEHDRDVYYIKDNDANKYAMPDVVGIYMSSKKEAQKVADIFNTEWYSFLCNPN